MSDGMVNFVRGFSKKCLDLSYSKIKKMTLKELFILKSRFYCSLSLERDFNKIMKIINITA